MIVGMILAGGTGSRAGAGRPKQFVEIMGKPVVAYTIEIYQRHPEADAVEVVCHKDWKEYLGRTVIENKLSKVRWIADGGDTFQESVMNGMNVLQNHLKADDIVMIHYGAAPFTSERIISDGIRVCKEKGMSASCTPCYQLMGSNDGGTESCEWADRDRYVQIACPQSFRFSYLQEIYRKAGIRGLLETAEPHTTSLMYALGETVYQSYGDQTNIKITTAEDIELFRYLAVSRKGTFSI